MSLSAKAILIIDDDPSLRMLLRKILETSGCIVEEADSVRMALDKIQVKLPDLVILDLGLPEHEGVVFLKFRMHNKLMHSIPVLVLSGETDKPVVHKALLMGANQFLEKPLQANLVLQKLRYLFYSQDHFSHQFSAEEMPTVTAEINASIVGQADGQLKVASVAKFERGKPLQLKIEDYVKAGGAVLVGRIDNRKIDTADGLYGQVMTLVGMSNEEKKKFQLWQSR